MGRAATAWDGWKCILWGEDSVTGSSLFRGANFLFPQIRSEEYFPLSLHDYSQSGFILKPPEINANFFRALLAHVPLSVRGSISKVAFPGKTLLFL